MSSFVKSNVEEAGKVIETDTTFHSPSFVNRGSLNFENHHDTANFDDEDNDASVNE